MNLAEMNNYVAMAQSDDSAYGGIGCIVRRGVGSRKGNHDGHGHATPFCQGCKAEWNLSTKNKSPDDELNVATNKVRG